MEKQTVSIVIVNWNTNDCVYECLESLEKSEQRQQKISEVVIVDNASNEKLDPGMFPENLHVVVVQNDQNLGFAKACNQGAEISKGDYVLFLNPDTKVFPDTLDGCVSHFNNLPKTDKLAVLGVQIVDTDGTVQKTCSRFPKMRYNIAKCIGLNKIFKSQNQFMFEWDHKESRIVDEVIGAFFFMKRDIYNEIGGFDERYFVYYEEVDFCKQIQDKGYYTYYLANEKVFHAAGAASEQVKAERLFYEWRSRYLYEQKHNGQVNVRRYARIRRVEVWSRILEKKLKRDKMGVCEIKRANDMFIQWKKESKIM